MTRAAFPLCLVLSITALSLGACDTADPSLAVVDNAYPAASDAAEQTTVYKVWWSVTEFHEPIAAGASSEDERVIPASDFAYLLLAPSWDPASDQPPAQLIPARTKGKVSVERGDRLHIVVNDDTVDGNCQGGTPLTQADADFITERVFPGDFANVRYDAASCRSTATSPYADAAVTGSAALPLLRGLDAGISQSQ